jgi:hypothetical protein
MSSNSDYEENTVQTTDVRNSKQNTLNALNIYFRCQKNMYEQSNIITEYKNNSIHGITITITSGICIFISFLETYQWRTIIIIVLNALVTILLVFSKYWKMEITAELYLYISRQFELIADSMFSVQYNTENGIISQNISSKIKDLEKRVIETRDIPNIVIPVFIQVLYPVSANINMFYFIRKVDSQIVFLKDELHTIKTEINYIMKKHSNNMGARETNRMHFLSEKNVILKKDLKYAENAYTYMEEILARELNNAEYYRNNYVYSFFKKRPDFRIDHSHCNPLVDEYISFIIPKK